MQGEGFRLLIVPIELRKDLCVQVQIPADLTVKEAEKIGRVIKAMAKDSPNG